MGEGTDAGLAIVDWEMAQEQVGDDLVVLKEVIGVLLDTCPGMTQEIRQAIEAGDAPGLRRAAHTLKGAVAVLAAAPAAAAALTLENLGRETALDRAPAALAVLEREVSRLVLELRARLEAEP
ncbi:MAG: Hpt domain-containing protein [Candidatus Latescibacterota bacterium]